MVFTTSANIEMEESSEIDKGHGRIEERKVRVCSDVDWFKKEKKWKSIKSVIEITSTRIIKGKKATEKRYCITKDKKFGQAIFELDQKSLELRVISLDVRYNI